MAHIAIVSRNYPPIWGGAERLAEQLVRQLANRGHRVTVLTAWRSGLPRREFAESVEIRRLGIGGEASRLNSPMLTLHLLWTIVTEGRNWDVLHNFLISTLSVICAFWAKWTGRRLFVSLGGTGATSDLGQMFTTSFQGARKFRFVARSAEFIACSSESGEQLKAAHVSPVRIHVMENPVDLNRFRPLDPALRRELRGKLGLSGRVAVFVGRLAYVKGPDRVCAAWPQVRCRYRDAILLIVGDGAERPNLEKKNIEGVRFVGAADPVIYYQAADLFILASRSEGMSLALLEAMATGLPVVATEVSGTKQLVIKGETGWIVDNTDDREPLVEGILRGFAPGVYDEMGPRARVRLESSYGLDQWMTTLLKLYGLGRPA
jgi:glycosyltransferase involved in cell wall biosynthesis